MSWHLDGRPLRRILVTRLRYLGDIAMSTVVLAALRRGDPNVRLGYLCEQVHAPLLAGHPLLSGLHALGVRRGGADAAVRATVGGGGPESVAGTLATVRHLRRERYDLAVDLFFNPRSAWLLRLAGIPARIGGAARGYRRRLYTHVAPTPAPAGRPGLYAVAGGGLGEHLSRLAPLRHGDGRPFLDWLEDAWPPGGLLPSVPRPAPGPDLAAALADRSLAGVPFLLLAPGATWATKEWPPDAWHDLVGALLADGHRIAMLCPPAGPGPYADAAARIPAGRGGLLPPLPLSAALAAVAASSLVVSVDGGIMHAAVAMRVPTVALFGPTDPALWFPYERGGPFRVLATRPVCHPCHRHECPAFVCLPDLEAGAVLAAVRGLLAGGAA